MFVTPGHQELQNRLRCPRRGPRDRVFRRCPSQPFHATAEPELRPLPLWPRAPGGCALVPSGRQGPARPRCPARSFPSLRGAGAPPNGPRTGAANPEARPLLPAGHSAPGSGEGVPRATPRMCLGPCDCSRRAWASSPSSARRVVP